MVIKEFLGPLDLAKAQALYIHELTEVVVVRKGKDLVFVAFQIGTPSLKGLNNGQELMIVGFVAGFSKDHFSKEKSYQMLFTSFR